MHPLPHSQALQTLGFTHKSARVVNDNHISTTIMTITTNTMFNMLIILSLIITAVLSTQIITAITLVFLFREMTQYICSLHNKVDKKKAKAEAMKGWGNW